MAEKPIQGAGLLPCPFCGGEGRVSGDDRAGHCVECCSCDAAMGANWDRDALPDHAYRTEEDACAAWNRRTEVRSAVQEEAARHGDARTPQDYAIEHAEYMAASVESLLQAMEQEDQLRLRQAESDDVEDVEIYDAGVTRSVLAADLRGDIYEFRKRRDRAAAPGVQAAPIQAHSKSQYKRLSALGADVVAPSQAAPVAAQIPPGMSDKPGSGSFVSDNGQSADEELDRIAEARDKLLGQATDIHSCSPFCERPGCVAAREWMEEAERLLGNLLREVCTEEVVLECDSVDLARDALLTHLAASPSLQAGEGQQ